jgi:hypothetical protein
VNKINELALLTLVTVGLFGCGYKNAVMNSPNISIPQNVSQEQLGKNVRDVLMKRRWIIMEEEKGFVTASIKRGQTAADIKITYDSKNMQIKRVNTSPNLRYQTKAGEERIHNHYNTWIANLEKDLKAAWVK